MNTNLLVNSKNKKILYLVDILNRTYRSIVRDTCNSTKYQQSEVTVCESSGTLAYVNKEYGFYGILRERQGGASIIWIEANALFNDSRISNIINNTDELCDITEYGLDVLEKSWNNKLKTCTTCKDLSWRLIGKNEFLVSIGALAPSEEVEPEGTDDVANTNKDLANTNIEEEPRIEIKEFLHENEQSFEENLKQTKENVRDKSEIRELFNSYLKTIEDRIDDIKDREQALRNKESDLQNKFNKLNNLYSNYDGTELYKLNEEVLDLDLVVSNGNVEVSIKDKPDYVWELMLKLLSENDSISISHEYYEKLHILPKKQLEANLSYTRYKSLASLKFNKNDPNNLVVMIEFDDTLPYVRINVIKPYGLNTFEPEEIRDYLTKYADWKRKTMRV